MKTLPLLAAAAVVLTSSLCAADRPAISARQAIDLAEKDLASRGLTQKLYIVSVTLDRASVFSSGASYWLVKWSDSIPASNPNNKEIGMKVRMDGTVTRLVKEPH